MTISYRRGRVGDAAAIDGVFRKSFCDTFQHLYRPQDLDAFLSEFTLDRWKEELEDSRFAFQVAKSEGQPGAQGSLSIRLEKRLQPFRGVITDVD